MVVLSVVVHGALAAVQFLNSKEESEAIINGEMGVFSVGPQLVVSASRFEVVLSFGMAPLLLPSLPHVSAVPPRHTAPWRQYRRKQ